VSIISSCAAAKKGDHQKHSSKSPGSSKTSVKSGEPSPKKGSSKLAVSTSHPHLDASAADVTRVKSREKMEGASSAAGGAAAGSSPVKPNPSPKRRKSLSELPPETPETLLADLAYEYQCYRELAYWAKREEDEIIARVEGGRMMLEHVEKIYDDMCPESICYRMIQVRKSRFWSQCYTVFFQNLLSNNLIFSQLR
jgi:hypothetical protein